MSLTLIATVFNSSGWFGFRNHLTEDDFLCISAVIFLVFALGFFCLILFWKYFSCKINILSFLFTSSSPLLEHMIIRMLYQ